jgi:exonuclease SbcD
MRILHTADWHVNDRLGRIDRTADLRTAVERIAGYCQSEKIDTLVIAGDLFSELARPDALRETVRHWRDQFSPFLARGGSILAVTGNHDSETFCQTLRHAMSLAGGEPLDGVLQPGRFFLATRPTYLKLGDVQFVLMPWPTASQYPDAILGAETPEEKTRRLSHAFRQALESQPIESNHPAVLVAHINVSGASVGPGAFRLSEQENVTIPADVLANRFCYAALGHVHKSQSPGGFEHVRYSGSIERMDLGEQHDVKSFTVVTVGAKGLIGKPELLPLPATNIYSVVITDPETDFERLKEEYPDAANDLVQLTIRYEAGRHRLEEILAASAKLFPRWYARDWKEITAIGPSLVAADEPDRTKGFAETVREYLAQELIQYAEADRAVLLAKVEEFLQAEAA